MCMDDNVYDARNHPPCFTEVLGCFAPLRYTIFPVSGIPLSRFDLNLLIRIIYRRLLLLCLFICCCAACAPDSPSRSRIYDTPFLLCNSSESGSRVLCVEVWLVAFAVGNQPNSAVENHVGRTLQFYLDNEPVDLEPVGSIETVYRILVWCFDTAPLAVGIHTLNAQASTTSGEIRSTTWEFEVRQGEPPLIITPEATASP